MAIAEAIEDDLKNEALPVATQPQVVGSVNVAPSSFIRVHQSAGLSNSVSSNEIAQPAQPISTVGASAGAAAAQQISPSKVTVPQIDEVRGAAGTETAAAALLRSSSMLQDFGLFVECEELDIKTEGEDDKFAVILPLESPVKSKIMFLDLEKSLKT